MDFLLDHDQYLNILRNIIFNEPFSAIFHHTYIYMFQIVALKAVCLLIFHFLSETLLIFFFFPESSRVVGCLKGNIHKNKGSFQ